MPDLRLALRRLLAAPGFTLTALLTLALGIGVNTSMFTVLNAALFRTLPYPEGERLVRIYRTSPQSQSWPHSAANFLDVRAHNTVFENLAASRGASYGLAEPGQPAVRLRGLEVTAEFFPVLGQSAALGRVFNADEDQPGKNRVAVLSHATWLERFGGDPDVIGRDVRLNSEPVTVVGVMPPGFNDRMLWGRVDVWRPIAFTPEQRELRDFH